MTYPKIQSPYKRNETGVFIPEFSLQVFSYLFDNIWLIYEKIDGFNVRVIWDGENVHFNGKSDNTAFTVAQLSYLNSIFKPNLFAPFDPCVIYGELVGPKCNGNVYKLKEHEFVLFDSYRSSNAEWNKLSNAGWQGTDFLDELCTLFKIRRSPCIAVMPLRYCVRQFLNKTLDTSYMISTMFPGMASEGFILRPECELTTSRNERVITKLKFRDKFSEGFDIWS